MLARSVSKWHNSALSSPQVWSAFTALALGRLSGTILFRGKHEGPKWQGSFRDHRAHAAPFVWKSGKTLLAVISTTAADAERPASYGFAEFRSNHILTTRCSECELLDKISQPLLCAGLEIESGTVDRPVWPQAKQQMWWSA